MTIAPKADSSQRCELTVFTNAASTEVIGIMSSRPEGTDGSDHVYREKVEKAYATLARTRKWGARFLYLSVLPMLLRTFWYTYMASVAGLTINYPALLICAMNVAASVTWRLARPGSPKENFNSVKVASAFNIGSLAMLLINAYKYHAMTSKDVHISYLLYLRMQNGGLTSALGDVTSSALVHWIGPLLNKVDVWSDVICFIVGCLAVSNLHLYISVKMALQKKSEELAVAAVAAKRAQAAKQSTAGASNVKMLQGTGPRRRMH
ncbi:hypothetical protein CEUSTIGMA_g12663.t1 [Chlamydomonas eustigma]|uniref:Uncharacterized protein n=1 Tax=Chlamydomonas eustigma TaxID=1157962 RepID=A0A250XQE0_9CHLO|nr:hypothetical protein CEUSTIGMA_g12663.t1 [Chlamydomonas eustigma]|eukprot:GAX85243.1 hypothetical protein CEUSTIGMA_g12663.t1 [Chlamydomonas eustigma]